MKLIVSRTKILACLMFALMAIGLNAQTRGETVKITGVVVDASGMPVIGAAVMDLSRPSNGCVADMDGKFAIDVVLGAELVVSSVGYSDGRFNVKAGQSEYRIVLKNDLQLEETVVVGYATQKKATLTGSVSSVMNRDIVTTKNENVQNMLTGKVAGLRVVQNSAEPGAFSSTIDIRGFGSPLVVIDGVPRDNMARIDAEDIESISVLKDASAAVYGVRAANGVILITTKRGGGGSEISYSGNMTWQMPSNFPKTVDAASWMILKNEQARHNVDVINPVIPYSQDEINAYLNGERATTDWVNAVFRNSAPQTQHNVNVSGGNDRVKYYASIGYQYQGSFLRTDAINYEKYNLRGNISAKLARNLTFDLNISGMMDERQSSVHSAWDIVRAMWLMNPMDGVWFNEMDGKYQQPRNTTLSNPVAMMDTDLVGHNSYKSRWFQSSAALTYDIPGVKGLSIRAMYSYDYIMNENKEFGLAYNLYSSAGDNEVSKTWNSQSEAPNRVARYYYGKNHYLWQAQVNYANSFGKHNVGGLLLFENYHKEGDNFYGERQSEFPMNEIFAGIVEGQKIGQSTSSGALYDYANQALVGRFNYDYAGKYIAEFAFRYEGSSRFPANSRWGFFPSFSAGYRISEENFWKNSGLRFIDNFKIRTSWGIMGDDSALAYQFMTGYNYPASGNAYGLPAGSVFDGKFINSSSSKGLPNNAISWYTSAIFNVGVDVRAWKGLLGVTAEYFRRERSGLLATRVNSLPGVVGATLPQENLNSDMDQGFEIELSHENRAGDFLYQIKGNVSYTMRMTRHYERAASLNSYDNWRNNNNNRYNNAKWGYAGDGRYGSWNEIYYNPVFIGRGTLPGDYKYEDWNGDGMISDLDVHPIGNVGDVPLINFGLTFSAQWKGLDFSILLQGAGRRYVTPVEFLYQPLWGGTTALEQFMDRWRPVDDTMNPYDPSAEWVEGYYGYTGSDPLADSEFNFKNAAYLRLKNVELGYSLPSKWLSAIHMKGVRIYVSGYNLLTFTGIKFMDPEFNYNNYGYNYPLSKTVTLGLNVKF